MFKKLKAWSLRNLYCNGEYRKLIKGIWKAIWMAKRQRQKYKPLQSIACTKLSGGL